MGAFVIQSLAFVWWLIMKIFSRYNEVRINRLREIENIFLINKTNKDMYPVKQYRYSYTLYSMSNWKKLFDWMKHPNKKHRGIKITFNRVYDLVLIETLVINISLIIYTI